jgi:hypothetical protein
MSTAAAFIHHRYFPFCVTDLSGGGYAYIDNLTLAQVMAFAWNMETFTLTTAGSATKGSASVDLSGTITSNSPTASLFDQGKGDGMWVPTVSSMTVWASWPSAKVPRARVCSSGDGLVCDFRGELSTRTTDFFRVRFFVGTDPSNSGKYRIYYSIDVFRDDSTGGDLVAIHFVDPNTSVGSMTAWQSGTITIGGLTFSWASYYTTGATPAGAGTLAASSSDYTY